MHFVNAESRISEVFGFVSSGNGTHKISVRETVRNMWRYGMFFIINKPAAPTNQSTFYTFPFPLNFGTFFEFEKKCSKIQRKMSDFLLIFLL